MRVVHSDSSDLRAVCSMPKLEVKLIAIQQIKVSLIVIFGSLLVSLFYSELAAAQSNSLLVAF